MMNDEELMKGAEESSKTVWLVGASEKSQTLGAALCGLGRWGPRAGTSPRELTQLGDLEELLSGQAAGGTLILDYELVPVEDIGFVRRFLERHPLWQMLVVGADRQEDCVQRLLKLARSEWLAWPPTLDQLSALLPNGNLRAAPAVPSSAPAFGASRSATRPTEPTAVVMPKATPTPKPTKPDVASEESEQALDLGKLFKELLINEHLAGHKWALEFQEGLTLPIDQRLAKLSFGAFINLARACAGREGLVRATLERAGLAGDPRDTVCLQMSFPQGSLVAGDQANVLLRPIRAEGKLGSAAKAALIAAEALRKRGGRVQMQAPDPSGSLCLEMHLSYSDLEIVELERLEAASEANIGSESPKGNAADPFA